MRPAEWHSELSPRQRARTWAAVAAGEVSVVVGARSALFLPYADLGLIVVDEEHDPAYKQEDGVHYHARDMAVVRARIAQIPDRARLGDAVGRDRGQRAARALPAARVCPSASAAQHLPAIEAIDLHREGPPRGRFIAPRLAEAVKTALERGEQALLFLNRRGYAPLTLCRACGFRLQCPNCDAWLVDHRFKRQLVCHHCGFAHAAARRPARNARRPNSFVACGPGVERLEEEVAELFPRQPRAGALQRSRRHRSSACARSSTTSRKAASTSSSARSLSPRAITFPKLNLVGVVDADLGLGNGDPRAAERTFQLLHQVIGRAGREEGRGIGYLQTHQPEHPVMRALIAQDREAFYASEIEARERTHYPPFGRLASLVVSGADKHATEGFARELARAAPRGRRRARARSGRGAARGGARAAPLPAAGEVAARLRPVGLSARMARRRAEGARASIKLEVDIDPQSFL